MLLDQTMMTINAEIVKMFPNNNCFFNSVDEPKKNRGKWYYHLVMINIAMENGPFIDGLPINSMVIFHS